MLWGNLIFQKGMIMTGSAKKRQEQLLLWRSLVYKLASQMIVRLPANVELIDLIQVGMIGLNESFDRFDPDQGVSFSTFATQRIRGAILDELRAADWMGRLSRRMRRKIDAVIIELEHSIGGSPKESEIANAMNMSLRDYQRLVDKLRGAEFVSLEDWVGDSCYVINHQEMVCPLADDPLWVLEERRKAVALGEAMKCLPERERRVLSMYHESGMNMKEISVAFGVTEGRICQLYTQAVKRLRAYLQQYWQQTDN